MPPLAGFEPLTLDLGKTELFDATVHGRDGVPTLQEAGNLGIITKDGVTESSRAIACLHFTVDVNGKAMRAQTVTSVRLLVSTFHALLGRYGHDGKVQPPVTPESMAFDVTQQMPAELLAKFRNEALALAVHRLGGKMQITPPDTVLAPRLNLGIGFDAKTMSFTLEAKEAQ